jgi:ATP-dependent 26S proteasome regulatory subunit
MSDSLTTVSREITRYKLDLVETQDRWDKGGTVKVIVCIK